MAIIINKETTRFFISINKIRGHSFVMLGIYDKNKVQHLLCRVGKFAGNRGEKPGCSAAMSFLYQAVFTSVQAHLEDEGVHRRTSSAISYQAYDITYANYLEFLQILEFLDTPKNKYCCFKPVATDGNEITLDLTNKLVLPKQSAPKVKASVCELGLGNTCRHSAITLVEETRHAPVSSLVSENFLSSLPYETQLDYGKISEEIPFYVLPAPPIAFPQLDKTKKKIITKLYERLENIPILETHSTATEDKFLRLKDLYLQIIGPQKSLPLDELLYSIQDWRRQNKSVLSSLRKTYFWDSFFTRTSATIALVTEIEHDLERGQLK